MGKQLFRALTKNDVEVRVQSVNDKGFTLLLYKDARVDQNILDETFGAFGWQNKYEEYKGNLYCSVGISGTGGQWIWKSNCGTESYTEKEKGEASDAFKRACFNWGIGRELYTCPPIKIKGDVENKNGKWVCKYYSFEVLEMEVSNTFPRRITHLKISGKKFDDGKYVEKVIICWNEPTLVTQSQICELQALGGTLEAVAKYYKVPESELTAQQVQALIDRKRREKNATN